MPFPIEEKFVLETEAKLNRKLPPWYRKIMMKENGGEFRAANDIWNLYPIFNQTSKKLISRTCNHILRETESAKGYPLFPDEAVAIAGNGTGDQLVFLPENDVFFANQLYFWMHDTGECEAVENLDQA